MTVLELRDKIISDGITSIETTEKRENHRRGGINGFELCKNLDTPHAFEKTLEERHKEERKLIADAVGVNVYWEYRAATVQIEFLWERMKIVWSLGPEYSSQAALHVNKILKGMI
jgi:hypothetical protein